MENIDSLIIGKRHQIKLALTCLLAGGHLLIEDLPGMGKTTLSHALAEVLGLKFSRVQFTSDLLPADLLGVNIFEPQKQRFQFHQGPLFNNLVLADEINRASPKTQSALLEAMEEHQVSVDGTTHQLPSPFFVIATQNPVNQSGTYPLPESQLDRFLMKIELGYPDEASERAMLKEQINGEKPALDCIITPEKLNQAQQATANLHASDAIISYVLKLVQQSRQSADFPHPLSPRASKAILKCSKSWAYIAGRDHVIPEDVQAVLGAVAEHRLRHNQLLSQQTTPYSQLLLERVDPVSD
nr:MoxR family ATPase [Neptunicella marina]